MSTMTELKHGYVEDNETASGLGEIPAVVRSAAVAAGIKDPASLTAINADLIKLDSHGHVTNPREVIEELRQRRPALFHKRANEMDQTEYEAARRRLTGIGRSAHLT
ncbi:MAG: hypothetical protein EKK46_15140 [Rhodocyclaceae bacterium]|nr:MAG: hypothetical protein EKK46_15140 [Rhodocyclaceae bacterium]